MNLSELMSLVCDHWPFNEAHYPVLKGLSQAERRKFALCHVLMHQMKAVGKLTEVCEPADHGAALNFPKLQLATRNFMINTLRLADLVGLTLDDVAKSVEAWAHEKHVS